MEYRIRWENKNVDDMGTLKLKLRVYLAGHSVAMVTYCVTNVFTNDWAVF